MDIGHVLGVIMGILSDPSTYQAMIRISTPLALAAIGGTFCERTGVVNIALEGIMLVGAFAGAVFSYYAQASWGFSEGMAPWVGLIGAVSMGMLFSLLHGVGSIHLRADQVVIGAALNILALGGTGFLTQAIFGVAGASPRVGSFDPVPIPGLVKIPFLGQVLFNHTPIVYMAIVIAIAGQFILFRTPIGLRLRSVGEHPKAADTVGISVYKMRYVGVLISGALGGLAGANLSLEAVSQFSENMTRGRGFIALAANIFGKWTPLGSWLSSLLFGFAESLKLRTQVIDIPPEFILMLPYVLTIVVLAGAMGRAIPPDAIGKPYSKQ
ncbi:MAG TPA: ABC transporter permease [Thermoleophilia bacterium]|nr:ABC transporter permease [Thermoleophilia bacterium]